MAAESGLNPEDPDVTGSGKRAQFVCTKCGKAFVRKQKLQYHDISQHTRSFTFSCHHCRKGFYQRYRYVEHLKKHANVFSQMCSFCGKGFFSKDALRYHTKKCSLEFAV
ncbi:Zinc finger protein 746 [Mizuhopecten yessoensis]|uniref:Zinc finger protein 746 n=1 Tax=Mizuhopecten yessoensis TaxID=6573 RepID=A0A210Q3L7_MIZYE|nr:Zinc finger protein 746 [Mizuhopecten yessoensis]